MNRRTLGFILVFASFSIACNAAALLAQPTPTSTALQGRATGLASKAPLTPGAPTATRLPGKMSAPAATAELPTPAVDLALACRQAVDGLASLQQDLPIPDHLVQEEAIRSGEEFDPNRYFTVLDRLAMPPGSTLDYVYRFEGGSGFPILYARPVEQAPYRTYAEYVAALGEPSIEAARRGFLAGVQADGTPESFVQYAVLRAMGSQFYLYWHAAYNDYTPLCDPQDLQAIIDRLKRLDLSLPRAVEKEARRLDFTPRVEIDG